jgi:hypothetical protein
MAIAPFPHSSTTLDCNLLGQPPQVTSTITAERTLG